MFTVDFSFYLVLDLRPNKALQFLQQVRGTFRPPLQVAEPLRGWQKLRRLPHVRLDGGDSRRHRRPARRRRTHRPPRQSWLVVQVIFFSGHDGRQQ